MAGDTGTGGLAMARHAAVTGGAQGIGRGTTERLLAEGWQVAALDADRAALLTLSKAHPGGDLLALPCDVAEEAEVGVAFEQVADWAGEAGLSLLFNNAGIAGAETGPVEDLSLAEWRRRVDASLTGTFLCTRAAIPLLRKAEGAAIVNMASTRAFQSEPDCEAYAAAKGGIVALTHALAVSLGPAIRVNCIAPGWIETRDWEAGETPGSVEHDAAEKAQHPAGRVGRPEDVAEAVLYLADAGFLTGQTLTIDGGMSKRMIYEA
jgi:NAD(P)-dependent dehydrogenase (short-subunit alcohol dehydrogenase family)